MYFIVRQQLRRQIKGLIGRMSKINPAARAVRTLEQFHAILCKTTMAVFKTTWAYNRKSLIVFIEFNGTHIKPAV